MSSRYNPPPKDELTDVQRRVADAITGGLRGEIPAPLAMWLRRPELADRAQSLGEYARYQTKLPPELSEVAILTVARHWGSEFEWHAQKAIALDTGIAAAIVERIRLGEVPDWDSPAQAIVHEFSKALLETYHVSDALFDRATEVLGTDGIVDLVGILGYYSMISMTINVFDVPLPPGAEPELR